MAGLNLGPVAGAALGQGLANIPEDIAGLQLQQAKASLGQSQAAEEQNKVQGGLAMNKSLAGNMANQPQANNPLDSLDNQAKSFQASAQQMAQAGRGDQAQAATQKAMELMAQKRQMALAQAAQASRSGNYDALKDLAPHMGIQGVDQVKYDDKTNSVQLLDKDGNAIGGMQKDTLDTLDLTPEQRANMEWHKFSAQMMAGSRENVAKTNAASRIEVQNAKGALPQDELGKIEKSVKAGLVSREEADAWIKFKETVKPTSASILMTTMPSAGTPQTFESDPARPWRDSPAFQEAIKKAPAIAGLLDQYLNGDLPPAGGRGVMIDKQIQAWGAKIDSNVSFRDYKLKQDAMKDPQVTAGNATLAHIGDFQKTLGSLDNATRSDIVNHSLNWIKQHAQGNETLSELDATALSLSEEYGKALGAGQNVTGDLKRENVFNPDAPLSVIMSKLHAVGNLIDKTIAAKENVLNHSNPKRAPLNLMDPKSLNVLQGLGINHSPGNRGGGGGGASAPEPPSSKTGQKVSADDAYNALMGLGSK